MRSGYLVYVSIRNKASCIRAIRSLLGVRSGIGREYTMEKLKAPSAMQFGTTNVAESWRRWEQQFRVYFEAAEVNKKAPKTHAGILLNGAGPEALEIYNTFVFNIHEDREPRELTVDDVLSAFKALLLASQEHRI